MRLKIVSFTGEIMRNATQEMSRHHGGESSVYIPWQQLAAGTACLVKAEWMESGPIGMGGLGMLPVYWLVMSVVTLGARDALRRAMDKGAIVNTSDPLKLSARELARLQGLTRAAMWLAGVLSVLCMGGTAAIMSYPIIKIGPLDILTLRLIELGISTAVFVWCLGVAALWVLLDIALVYLHKVGDGRFATALEFVVAAVFAVIVIVPVLGSGGIALIGVSAVFLIGWIIALARMHRVKPWMPEKGMKDLLRETPLALLGMLLYVLFIVLNGAEADRFPWGGYTGMMGFYHLVVISAVLGLLMMEMAKPARRLDNERTAPLAAGVSAFLLLIGLIVLGMRFGIFDAVEPIGVLYRFQFFFAAGFVLMVMYAKQNIRLILAEVALFFGISFALCAPDGTGMILRCLAYAALFALLCLPEWVRALKRLGKWLKTI